MSDPAWFPGCAPTRHSCGPRGPVALCDAPQELAASEAVSAPLFSAVKAGDTPLVSSLLTAGFFIDALDRKGWTPLHYASDRGYVPIARLLLKHHATPDLKAKDGTTTPMVLARSEEMRDLLRSYDPAIGWAYRDGTNPPRGAATRPAAPPAVVPAPPPPSPAAVPAPAHAAPESPGSPPAATAASPAGEARLDQGSSGAALDAESPRQRDQPLPARSVTPLPVWGPPSISLSDSSKVGQALAQACFFCDLGEIKALIDQGVDVNNRDADGMTGLHWVASRGGLAAAEALVAAGADVNAATTKEGWTPLHWAARAGREDIARVLLMSGAAVAVRNATGRTPLQMCTSEKVRALLVAHGGVLDPVPGEHDSGRAPVAEAAAGAAPAEGELRMNEEDQDVILREMRRIRQSRSRSPSPLPWGGGPPVLGMPAPVDSQALAKALSNVSLVRAASPRRARFASVNVSDLLSGDTPVGSIDAKAQQAAADVMAPASGPS